MRKLDWPMRHWITLLPFMWYLTQSYRYIMSVDTDFNALVCHIVFFLYFAWLIKFCYLKIPAIVLWHLSTTWRLLTHWGRATHICISKLTIIASDNGLSPGRRQANILNNAGLLSIGLLWTNFSEILIEILTFSFKKMRLKVSSAKRRPFVSASMC